MQRLSSGSWLVSLSTVASESVHVVAGVAGSSLRLNGLGVHLRKDCCGFDLLDEKGVGLPGPADFAQRCACVRQDPAGCLRVTRVRASVAPLCLAVFPPVCSGRGRYPEACF